MLRRHAQTSRRAIAASPSGALRGHRVFELLAAEEASAEHGCDLCSANWWSMPYTRRRRCIFHTIIRFRPRSIRAHPTHGNAACRGLSSDSGIIARTFLYIKYTPGAVENHHQDIIRPQPFLGTEFAGEAPWRVRSGVRGRRHGDNRLQ